MQTQVHNWGTPEPSESPEPDVTALCPARSSELAQAWVGPGD